MVRAFGIEGQARINFVDSAVSDILRAVSSPIGLKSKTGSFVLSLALIDYMLSVNSNGQDYEDWVNNNMKGDFSAYDGEILWRWRCQYLHNYGPNKPPHASYTISFNDSFMPVDGEDPHMREYEGKICVETPRIVADIIFSVMRELPNVSETELGKKLQILWMDPNRAFSDMHPYLKEFDKYEPSRSIFQEDVKELFKTTLKIDNWWIHLLRKAGIVD